MLASGYPATDIKVCIDSAVEEITRSLKEMATPVSDNDMIAQVGTISANGAEDIGQMIAHALDQVGRDGVVTVEEAKGFDTTVEIVEGMQIDRGYVSPYFVTNGEKMTAELKNPYIFITTRKLTSLSDIVTVLEGIVQQSKPVLFIAEDVEGDALQGLVVNKMKGVVEACAITSPGFGGGRIELIDEQACLKAEYITIVARDLDAGIFRESVPCIISVTRELGHNLIEDLFR